MWKAADLTCQRFGRLTAIRRAKEREKKNRKAVWECRCDCGNVHYTTASRLQNGGAKSCGCWKIEEATKRIKQYNQENPPTPRKHGMTGTKLYDSYQHMISRCYNPRIENYHNYGGRGIKVCDEWRGEEGASNFISWALSKGYKDGLTIDRIDVNGDYTPDNCRWCTQKEQQNNKRSNVYINYNGEKITLTMLAERIGIKPATIWWRYKKGWPIEDIANPNKNFRRGGQTHESTS